MYRTSSNAPEARARHPVTGEYLPVGEEPTDEAYLDWLHGQWEAGGRSLDGMMTDHERELFILNAKRSAAMKRTRRKAGRDRKLRGLPPLPKDAGPDAPHWYQSGNTTGLRPMPFTPTEAPPERLCFMCGQPIIDKGKGPIPPVHRGACSQKLWRSQQKQQKIEGTSK